MDAQPDNGATHAVGWGRGTRGGCKTAPAGSAATPLSSWQPARGTAGTDQGHASALLWQAVWWSSA